MGVGPVCWTSHPLAFPSGSWATFPMRGTVPRREGQGRVEQTEVKQSTQSRAELSSQRRASPQGHITALLSHN